MMTRIDKTRGWAVTDPLKHSQALGGTMAFLGLNRSMPLLHGSQGCSAFAKALLTRHFREPIPLQTTALVQSTVVMGGEESLEVALETITTTLHPDIIGVLSTGLTEMSGDDSAAIVKSFSESRCGEDGPLVVFAATPDFSEGLERGWASAVEAVVSTVPEDGSTIPRQVNLLVGPSLTALDVEELHGIVKSFDLEPIALPNLSGSMDGHLTEDWSGLTTGGTTAVELKTIGRSEVTLAVGSSVFAAGSKLNNRFGIPALNYPRLTGLGAVDSFISDLSEISGIVVPGELMHWRRRLADAMLDTHFILGGVRVALALEPDLLLAISSLLDEMGAIVVAAVSPTSSPILDLIPCDEVKLGDLAELETRASEAGAELIIASSHARSIAQRLGAAHLRIGFPVFDRFGQQYQLTAGYRGTLDLLFSVANCLTSHDELRIHSGHVG